MKKMITIFMLFLMAVVLVGCDETTYQGAVEFYYSSDAGASYGNRTKEFYTGENIYLQVILKVDSSSKSAENIDVTLTIPNSTSVSARYFDGQIITPDYDSVLNVTKYTFTIVAKKNANEWNMVFQFVANSESDFTVTLEFDDKVDSIYNKQSTITFTSIPEGE